MPPGESYILYSFKKLYSTLKKARQLPELFKFLCAWFIYSDGISTISGLAILYSQTQLGADQNTLLAAGVLSIMVASIGAFAWYSNYTNQGDGSNKFSNYPHDKY